MPALVAGTHAFLSTGIGWEGVDGRAKPGRDEAGTASSCVMPALIAGTHAFLSTRISGKAWKAGQDEAGRSRAGPSRVMPALVAGTHAFLSTGIGWQGVDGRPKAGQDGAGSVHPASCPHLLRALARRG
jgi:hypothetical protein